MKIEILKLIPISRILEEVLDAENNIDWNENKWKIAATGQNIQVSDNSWYNWNTQECGNGGVSLVKSYITELYGNIPQKEANFQLIDLLQPIYREYEKLELKAELDETLSNNSSQSPKLKI
jgi:hypothetical protein